MTREAISPSERAILGSQIQSGFGCETARAASALADQIADLRVTEGSPLSHKERRRSSHPSILPVVDLGQEIICAPSYANRYSPQLSPRRSPHRSPHRSPQRSPQRLANRQDTTPQRTNQADQLLTPTFRTPRKHLNRYHVVKHVAAGRLTTNDTLLAFSQDSAGVFVLIFKTHALVWDQQKRSSCKFSYQPTLMNAGVTWLPQPNALAFCSNHGLLLVDLIDVKNIVAFVDGYDTPVPCTACTWFDHNGYKGIIAGLSNGDAVFSRTVGDSLPLQIFFRSNLKSPVTSIDGSKLGGLAFAFEQGVVHYYSRISIGINSEALEPDWTISCTGCQVMFSPWHASLLAVAGPDTNSIWIYDVARRKTEAVFRASHAVLKPIWLSPTEICGVAALTSSGPELHNTGASVFSLPENGLVETIVVPGNFRDAAKSQKGIVFVSDTGVIFDVSWNAETIDSTANSPKRSPDSVLEGIVRI